MIAEMKREDDADDDDSSSEDDEDGECSPVNKGNPISPGFGGIKRMDSDAISNPLESDKSDKDD